MPDSRIFQSYTKMANRNIERGTAALEQLRLSDANMHQLLSTFWITMMSFDTQSVRLKHKRTLEGNKP